MGEEDEEHRRAAGLVDRSDDRRVIGLQDLQEQGSGELLLRGEEMEEAAVGRTGAGADLGHRRAFEAVAVEHRQSRRQQIFARRAHCACLTFR